MVQILFLYGRSGFMPKDHKRDFETPICKGVNISNIALIEPK
jgi:hypothetical protein